MAEEKNSRDRKGIPRRRRVRCARQGGLFSYVKLEEGGEDENEDPRVNPTRGAPKFIFRTYAWATRRYVLQIRKPKLREKLIPYFLVIPFFFNFSPPHRNARVRDLFFRFPPLNNT